VGNHWPTDCFFVCVMPSGGAIQSVLVPAGVQAFSIHRLWLLMFWVTVVVFVVTLGFVATALMYGSARSRSQTPPTSPRALTRSVATAVTATVFVLVGLLVVSVRTGRTIASLHADSAVTVNLIGHQWWWEIHYEDSVPSRRVLTANELHIPINRPVVLKVTSRDVIHSFWVPNLQGKRDLIPGYITAVWLQADRPGTFRGQCAEFCGLQHAHMALEVVAESEQDFEGWLDAMRQPGRDPPQFTTTRGQEVFMRARCAGCHAIRGTEASGHLAPDLTHVASRSTLGAGTLPNTPENLVAWIRDPQRVKPGNQMPPNPLSDENLQALVAYLETLR
jgi:cytochrome c oxidase subunit II